MTPRQGKIAVLRDGEQMVRGGVEIDKSSRSENKSLL